jgi:hypothetical protein
MIRTTLTPDTKTVFFDVPDDYIGKELEIIAFTKQEGLVKEKAKKAMADFWGTISDETAKKLHENVKTMRSEWEKDI